MNDQILVFNLVAKTDKPDRDFSVGDKLRIRLHDGRIVDATVRAIVDEGEKLQIDFGHEETALVKTSQVVDLVRRDSVTQSPHPR